MYFYFLEKMTCPSLCWSLQADVFRTLFLDSNPSFTVTHTECIFLPLTSISVAALASTLYLMETGQTHAAK